MPLVKAMVPSGNSNVISTKKPGKDVLERPNADC